MRGRIWVAASAGGLLAAVLIVCSSSPPQSRSHPAESARATASSTSTGVNVDLAALLEDYEAALKFDDLAPDPCQTSGGYTDTDCGARLEAEKEISDAVTKEIESSYAKLPQAAAVKKFDSTIDQSIETLTSLACYGLGAQPPKQSASSLEKLCPTLAPIPEGCFLSIETEILDPGSYSTSSAALSRSHLSAHRPSVAEA